MLNMLSLPRLISIGYPPNTDYSRKRCIHA